MGSELERRVLSALALRSGQVMPADALAEAVFGDGVGDATARLQKHVSRLRKRLGPEAVVTEGRGYRLGPVWEVDARQFEAALASARADRERGALPPPPSRSPGVAP